MSSEKKLQKIKFLIIGAGPCGLGTAYRLNELGINDYLILEKEKYVGGLATSFVDQSGFTWDIGGHVLHSHYDYFDKVFDKYISKGCYKHQRSAWVWLYNNFVPYPFQNNLKYLPKNAQWDCVEGLIDLKLNQSPKNFKEWLKSNLGAGICKHFAFPYNFKVWAHPLEKMNKNWVGDRVTKINLKKTLKNILLNIDDGQWGPNNIFYFPKKNGTGYIWKKISEILPKEKIRLNSEVIAIDSKKKIVTLSNSSQYRYENLVSTMPITLLLKKAKLSDYEEANKHLNFSTTHIVGLGLKGKIPKDMDEKCWIYYPEDNSPFYRVTSFAKYSPKNTAEPGKQWSLMFEVSESKYKKVNRKNLINEVIQGAINTKLISSKKLIVSTWHYTAEHGYPTPTLGREKVIDKLLKNLDKLDIYSRGRFGAWKYEVGNMDHSFMQGVEVIDKIVNNKKEVTVWNPNKVNQPH